MSNQDIVSQFLIKSLSAESVAEQKIIYVKRSSQVLILRSGIMESLSEGLVQQGLALW